MASLTVVCESSQQQRSQESLRNRLAGVRDVHAIGRDCMFHHRSRNRAHYAVSAATSMSYGTRQNRQGSMIFFGIKKLV
jgi:hypothetical protein